MDVREVEGPDPDDAIPPRTHIINRRDPVLAELKKTARDNHLGVSILLPVKDGVEKRDVPVLRKWGRWVNVKIEKAATGNSASATVSPSVRVGERSAFAATRGNY